MTLAHKILAAEQKKNPHIAYDPTIVTLGALMHDMGDHKYAHLVTSTDQSQSHDLDSDPTTIVRTTLLSLGASLHIATTVRTIAKNVSYSHEARNQYYVQKILALIPELGIVQDADRLDAIGAIGISRTFTFGGVRGRVGGLQDNVDHFEEKLYKVAGKMKTAEGRRLAGVRTERCRAFEQWWEEEMREGRGGEE